MGCSPSSRRCKHGRQVQEAHSRQMMKIGGVGRTVDGYRTIFSPNLPGGVGARSFGPWPGRRYTTCKPTISASVAVLLTAVAAAGSCRVPGNLLDAEMRNSDSLDRKCCDNEQQTRLVLPSHKRSQRGSWGPWPQWECVEKIHNHFSCVRGHILGSPWIRPRSLFSNF